MSDTVKKKVKVGQTQPPKKKKVELTPEDLKNDKRSPLQLVPYQLLTDDGRDIVYNDKSFGSEWTINALRESESAIVPNKYKYVLEETTPGKWRDEIFLANDGLGLLAVEMILTEKPKMNWAELCACYAVERNLPYIVAVIWILDLRDTLKDVPAYKEGLKYRPNKKKSEYVLWESEITYQLPPKKNNKLYTNRSKILFALDRNAWDISKSAKELQISSQELLRIIREYRLLEETDDTIAINDIEVDGPLFQNTRSKIDFIKKNGGTTILPGLDLDETENEFADDEDIPTVKQAHEDALSEAEYLQLMLSAYNDNISKAAEACGITPKDFKQRCEVNCIELPPQITGDIIQQAQELGLTEKQYLESLILKHQGDITAILKVCGVSKTEFYNRAKANGVDIHRAKTEWQALKLGLTERDYLESLLAKHNWNMKLVAEACGVAISVIQTRMTVNSINLPLAATKRQAQELGLTEKEYLESLILKYQGDIKAVAEVCGVASVTIYRRLKANGIQVKGKKGNKGESEVEL